MEHGYRTWPDLKHDLESRVRVVEMVETGLLYREGEPVTVRVVRRDHRTKASDAGRAMALADATRVPEEIARRIEQQFCVNVARNGDVFLPGAQFADRIGRASLALYEELLDAEE